MKTIPNQYSNAINMAEISVGKQSINKNFPVCFSVSKYIPCLHTLKEFQCLTLVHARHETVLPLYWTRVAVIHLTVCD